MFAEVAFETSEAVSVSMKQQFWRREILSITKEKHRRY